MSIWQKTLLHGILCLLLPCSTYVDLLEIGSRECFCSLESSPHDIESVELLTCRRRHIIDTKTQLMVQCQQVKDVVRIGPVYSTNQSLDNTSSWTVDKTNITLADWGFADLMKNSVIRRLQLSLDLVHRAIDAVAMAGLETLEELLARTNRVDWDSCALANLMQLKEATLNCKSNFYTFLTFGGNLETVRFVDCEGVALQFHCITCIQDKRIRVIRIRPGPPLNRFMVRFQNIQNYDPPKLGAHLLVGQCLPGVCSDEMMCRNNVPLLQVRHQLTKIVTPVDREEEESTSPNSTQQREPVNVTSELLDGQVDTGDRLVRPTGVNRPDLRWFYSPFDLSSGRYRYWVVAALLSVTLAFLVTVCVLISLTRQHRQPNKSTVARKARFPLLGCNGKSAPAADEEDTLSLPDVTPGLPQVSA